VIQLLVAIILSGLACTVCAAPNAADRMVLTRLDKAVTIETGELALRDAIETIAGQANIKTKINWPALEIVGIDPKTIVWLELKAVPATQVLQIALDQASADAFDDDKAGFTVRDGAVAISTLRDLKFVTETRDYSIRKYLGAARGQITVQEMVDQFIELINVTIGDPDEWLDEESTITEKQGKLTIKTTADNHAEIVVLFDQIDNPIARAFDLKLNDKAAKASRAAEARLKKRIRFDDDNAALSDVIASIRKDTDLNIAVNWSSLELVGIKRDSLVTLNLKRVPASELLQVVLDQISADLFDDDKAGYVLQNGVVYIDTLRMLKGNTETQVYKLNRWLGKKAGNEDAVDQVINAIHENVGDPDEWLDEESTLTNLYGLLVVTTTPDNHAEIVELLGKIGR
jgi:hypothetical protein